MNRLRLYKVYYEGLDSPYQGFQYEQGKEYHCDVFDSDPENECSNGFYATGLEGLPYSWKAYDDMEIWEVEVWGDRVEVNEFKRRYENIRVVRQCDIEDEIIPACKKIEDILPYILSEVIQPIDPLYIDPPKITDEHVGLLRDWASVRASVRSSVSNSVRGSVKRSVRASVWASVWASVKSSVWDSVKASVRYSLRDSVRYSLRDSVKASVRAYTGSLFTCVEDWKHIEHDQGEYPFQPSVDLWKQGLVPSHGGETWKLHGGEDAEVLFEISESDLMEEDGDGK